jgi:PPOX class probable F420-dependent enzyme
MSPDEARSRFAAARVARMATVTPDGRPHVVPICFAVDGDTILSAVDTKPKRTPELKRLRNLEANPAVTVLVDFYDEDWTRVWWARADGTAIVHDHQQRAIELLTARYPQFTPAGRVIEITVNRWSGWLASPTAGR